MEYIYAALLLHKAGQPIEEAALEKVLTAAGVKSDKARVKSVAAAIAGINIEEAMKTAAMPMAAPAPAASSAAPAKEGPAKKEEPKKKEQPQEEVQGLGALFG